MTTLELSEFDCLECARVQPVLRQLEADYRRKIRVVWKNHPRPRHDKGLLAAEAGLAAYEQQDQAELQKLLSAAGTPIFFINGKLLGVPYTLEAFRKRIDFELAHPTAVAR